MIEGSLGYVGLDGEMIPIKRIYFEGGNIYCECETWCVEQPWYIPAGVTARVYGPDMVPIQTAYTRTLKAPLDMWPDDSLVLTFSFIVENPVRGGIRSRKREK